jgi:hypothetical protein
MRMISVVISVAVRGRPGVWNKLPSYFFAISFRCQANSVSGVTICCDLTKQFPTEFLRFGCEPTALIVAKSHSTRAHLFSKNPILFNQVLDYLLLMLVHPASHGGDEKGELVETRCIAAGYHAGCNAASPLMISMESSFCTVRGKSSPASGVVETVEAEPSITTFQAESTTP